MSHERKCDYPQENTNQSWIVDYPLLAYKTASPTNKEIAVAHMALPMPQRVIHLGEWEFVSFVNHTQMVEQKLFGKAKETNCDIMFLVRRKDKYRLMSFKSNPWLRFRENVAATDDSDIYKQTLFLFSGWVEFDPRDNEDLRYEKDPNFDELQKEYNRRMNSDKIQNVQLITSKNSNYDQYMLIIQFNDTILSASLNKNHYKIKFLTEPQAMIRRHLVRGYNEKVYFAESLGNAVKIQELEFHRSNRNEITKDEIHSLVGSFLVAFEADGEFSTNDIDNEECSQSLYIMDDAQRIYHLFKD